MIINESVILTWVLFLALFPMSFFWLRRAFRIFVKKNISDVALKRGEAPKNQKKWAKYVGMLNLLCGLSAVWAIAGVLVLGYSYDKWSAIAGSTIWMKIIFDFIIRQQAHPFLFGKKKKAMAAS